MRFEFAIAQRIIFGEGTIQELAPAAASLGRRALMVVGRSRERAAGQLGALEKAGLSAGVLMVAGEPSVELVLEGVAVARSRECDMVVAIGGGSAMDTGKAVAALVPNPGDIHDYLEVVGKGQPFLKPSLPVVAVPTTAGTGSETTRNAVLTVGEEHVKASLRGPSMLPRLAIVDPSLTYDLPQDVTAASGLDALTQLIEPFVSIAANPITDAICRDGIRIVACSLRRAYDDGSDHEARAGMAVAALLSGMALANAKLGAVHGFAAPIGGMFPAPHAAVCARLLAPAVRVNLAALRERAPASERLGRFDELGTLLAGNPMAKADDAVSWLADLCEYLDVPPLRTYGLTSRNFPTLVRRAATSSSMRGNPVTLTDEEMAQILAEAL